MKIKAVTGIILIALGLSTAACTDDAVQPSGPTIFHPLKTTKSVEKRVNVHEVQKSIQEFYAASGRYPADLNEVAAFNGITLDSDDYVYDPATGTLTQKSN